ncbi:hypothetical protein J5N97_019422 [Dioscorea zingiberensis]|uniref:Protein BZR1 homolog n=1 Tax=Dioscorea zingiberensis TaxID=325984 RepID=A0A9D5HCV1_9LILI|nr:hypothetical protein J5N97_019422 [Dioscorea zingiberensis]
MPTWKERENNKRRERRRRAIAAKIYAGLRMYGNYKLPKHCDNNEVLKAVCAEAGWTVEEDGTTYRKGCKPMEPMEVVGASASPSPCSSYQPSPCTSYNPSPASSSFASPASSSYITNPNNVNNVNNVTDGNSLIPWLKNLASSSSSSKNPNHYYQLYMHGGSISAPVTPPLSSPTARSPRIKTDWDDLAAQASWGGGANCTFQPASSMPQSPRRVIPDSAGWLAGLQIPSGGSSSPTFSFVSSNPFGGLPTMGSSSSRMWTPGQSGTCSPVIVGSEHTDVQMSDEFAFGSGSNGNLPTPTVVKPWEGERIHEECGSDELELTLGSSKTRSDTR